MANKPQGDWGELRELILSELKRLNNGIEDLKTEIKNMNTKDIGELRTQMAVLQTKAALLGTIGGTIMGTIGGVITYMVAHH